MESIENNELLNGLCQEYNIELPKNLQNRKIYEEIVNFKDAEYIYCIAYEMLIRTDEYKQLLKEYEPLKNISKNDMTNEEFLKLRELIERMNDLGLKKTSFLGFDCDDDNDHVFKRIEYYDEVINSPWSVRIVHKFQIDQSSGFHSIYHMLIDFYNKKNELYVFENGEYKNISLKPLDTNEEDQTNVINNIHITEIHKIIDNLFISYSADDNLEYKALKDIVYLKELDEDFLSLLKEKKNSDLLIQTKSNFSYYNTNFWNKYSVNDIKNGLNKLVDFHVSHNLIYDKSGMRIVNISTNQILKNPTNFYIPCANRMEKPEYFPWSQMNDEIPENYFQEQLKYNGHDYIIAQEGFLKVKREDVIYLINIDKYISLSYLHDSFLETLEYEDLKNKYIETEPLFSRPRLMFDEARLTNIPINLNLSKEDLLLYISQIKDDYDRDKNIVKTDEEYFFDLTLESDLTSIPSHIKYAHEKRSSSDKKLLPVKRHDFTKSFASAFYIYDLFKFFIPLFEKKRNDIREKRDLEIKELKDSRGIYKVDHDKIDDIKKIAKSEIIDYENDNMIVQIVYLHNDDLSKEQVEYFLTTMKEFIHGVNQKGENNVFKKQYDPTKEEDPEPKYKNLIIGDSYIIKSNKSDLSKILLD